MKFLCIKLRNISKSTGLLTPTWQVNFQRNKPVNSLKKNKTQTPRRKSQKHKGALEERTSPLKNGNEAKRANRATKFFQERTSRLKTRNEVKETKDRRIS